MKSKSLIFVLLLSLSLLFTACNKDPLSEAKSLLVDKDWVEANVGDDDIIVYRFDSDGSYVVIYLTKCTAEDFCEDRIFDYDGVEYYVEDVSFGPRWLMETETSLKLFSDKESYVTYKIEALNKETLTLSILDVISRTYKNYGSKVSRLARFKSQVQQ